MGNSSFWRRLPPATAKTLQAAGMSRPRDLFLHLPMRYENWQSPQTAKQLKHGEKSVVEGVIDDVQIKPWRVPRRQMLVCIRDDEDGYVVARFFNPTTPMVHSMSIGRRLRLLGTAKFSRGWEMAHPKIQSAAAPGKMQPVYTAPGGLAQDRIRRAILQTLREEAWEETVPEHLRDFDGGQWTAHQALSLIHEPPESDVSNADASNPAINVDDTIAQLQAGTHPALNRLRFDELLAHQIILRSRRRRRNSWQTATFNPPQKWDAQLREALPFKLTAAQQRAVDEICKDLSNSRPMRRLLQGDVGSGKTAVAAFALLAAAASGKHAVLMAPTEILARQHYETLSAYFKPCRVNCELLTGAVRGKKRKDAMARLRLGLSHIAIGTHALFQEESRISTAALAVIDEQQRFGVEQRRALSEAFAMHQLMMTATPIPRTLAMSAYADTDITVLDEHPPGRGTVRTILVSCQRRDEVLERIVKQKAAYWVCPLIEGAESVELQDVFSLAAHVKEHFPELSPEVLHGRQTSAEKQDVIDRFRAGKTRLLIATTVIEVGVDVPQADVMVVDHAERMGLSQLHQLRGRVGRGGNDGTCIFLYADDLSDDAKSRLKILHGTSDGFRIAEEDLRLRGPGEWLGTRQSGLPMFTVARPGENSGLVAAAGKAAEWMLDNARRECAVHARRWFGGRRG